jgi:hypothetical protein
MDEWNGGYLRELARWVPPRAFAPSRSLSI